MDRKIPVINWSVRAIPDKNPMFHKSEMDEGVGRSFRELDTIFIIGLVFVN